MQALSKVATLLLSMPASAAQDFVSSDPESLCLQLVALVFACATIHFCFKNHRRGVSRVKVGGCILYSTNLVSLFPLGMLVMLSVA